MYTSSKQALLSKRAYPFFIKPVQKNGMFVFTDWGYNHALIPLVSGFFAVGVVWLVHAIGYNGWGNGGAPKFQAIILLLVGIPLILHGLVSVGTARRITLDVENGICTDSTVLFGFFTVGYRSYECDPLLEMAAGTVFFSRRGFFKNDVHGLFLSFDGASVPRKLIACHKDREKVHGWATRLANQMANIEIAAGSSFCGRLTR